MNQKYVFNSCVCDFRPGYDRKLWKERDDRSRKGTRAKQSKEKGESLSSKPTESEDTQREEEHKDVKVKNVFGFVEYVLNDGF